MTLYIILGITVIIVIYIMMQSKRKSTYKEITSAELKPLLRDKNTVLIDVRTKNEIRQGVIGKPLEIELGPFMKKKFEGLDKGKKYILYCRSGRRSAMACSIMTDMGFRDVSNLVGGYLAWNA